MRVHLTGRETLSDTEREWLALAARNGGLGIPHPLQLPFISDSSLVELIRQQNTNYPVGAHLKPGQVKDTINISTTVMQPKRRWH